jgi:hypothetical protein
MDRVRTVTTTLTVIFFVLAATAEAEARSERMTMWYGVHNYKNEITSVEVVRETAKQIIILEPSGRESWLRKRGDIDYSYFPSMEAARSYLAERLEKQIAGCKIEIANAEDALHKLKSSNPCANHILASSSGSTTSTNVCRSR